MKKTYSKPQMQKVTSSQEDIMNGSDVLVDVSDLFEQDSQGE